MSVAINEALSTATLSRSRFLYLAGNGSFAFQHIRDAADMWDIRIPDRQYPCPRGQLGDVICEFPGSIESFLRPP